MARPIEATPVLEGADAERLLSDLKKVCSMDEARRRIESAKKARLRMFVSSRRLPNIRHPLQPIHAP